MSRAVLRSDRYAAVSSWRRISWRAVPLRFDDFVQQGAHIARQNEVLDADLADRNAHLGGVRFDIGAESPC